MDQPASVRGKFASSTRKAELTVNAIVFGVESPEIQDALSVAVTRFNARNPTRTIQVPRAPLHAQGVTSNVAVSRTASAGVTPPSSLIRTHAQDQNAPVDFGRP